MSEVITTKGIAIREETIVSSKSGGYINYYTPDLSKIYSGEIVYSLDTTGKIKEYISEEIEENKTASDRTVSSLKQVISDFHENYDYSKFEDVYSLKQKLDNIVLSSNGQYIEQTLDKIQEKYGKNAYQICKSSEGGVISYTYDNFEKTKAKDVTASDFEQNRYEKLHLSSNSEIEAKDAVYRIVTSENWQLVVSLSEEQYEQLKGRDSVDVTFLQDDISTTAALSVEKKKKHYYGYLTLSKYMIRYINDRYLDLLISLESDDGYKIPKSSVVEKEFYQVPVRYLTQGGNSTSNCVLAKSKKDKTPTIQNYSIYKYEEDKDEYFYLSATDVDKGTVLFSSEDSDAEQYSLEKTVKKKGVYSINQGYAKFRAIEELSSDDEYLLISTETVRGVSLYDHIIYDASEINENEVIY
jgi:hypothetical protein